MARRVWPLCKVSCGVCTCVCFEQPLQVPKSGEPVPDTGYANPTDLRLSAGIPAWANNLIVRGDVNNGDESAPTLDLISVLNLAEAATVMGIKMYDSCLDGRAAGRPGAHPVEIW